MRAERKPKAVLLVGMEAHSTILQVGLDAVCLSPILFLTLLCLDSVVLTLRHVQTALDLLAKGHAVYVLSDCIARCRSQAIRGTCSCGCCPMLTSPVIAR